MGIYIKGAKLPTSCSSCPFEYDGDCYGGKYKYIMDVDDDEEQFRNIRHPNCPLVYIPEPHGRLIDETKAMGILDKYRDNIHIGENTLFFTEVVDCTKLVIKELAPTVIEGSE